jgi:hypothetical protein
VHRLAIRDCAAALFPILIFRMAQRAATSTIAAAPGAICVVPSRTTGS